MMKRFLTLLAVTLSFGLMAQEGPKISSAVIALDRNKDLKEAKNYIDEAAEIINNKEESEVKYKDLRKFYYYNGVINYRIAANEDPEIRAMDPDALEKARKSLQRVIEYESSLGKERYSDEAKEQLPYVAQLYAQEGINASQNQKFEEAYNKFMTTYKLKKSTVNQVDTTMLYNAALMAQNAEMYDEALDILNQLMDMGYQGVTFKATNTQTGEVTEFGSKRQMEMMVKSGDYTDPRSEGDVRPDLYVTAANINLIQGDTAAYDEMVARGREIYPENEALLRAELQKFLETEQYDKAMVNLNQAIEKDPENKLFHYIKGYILQTSMDSLEAAREAYRKAIEIDSNYVEPLYMLGLTHVDYANSLSKRINELPLDAKKKYDALKKEQKEAFEKALPYFEQAHEADPTDMDTLNALKEVYYKLKMVEKAQEVQAKINQLG